MLREYTQDTAGWSANEDSLYHDGQLLAAETPFGRKHFHFDPPGAVLRARDVLGLSLRFGVLAVAPALRASSALSLAVRRGHRPFLGRTSAIPRPEEARRGAMLRTRKEPHP